MPVIHIDVDGVLANFVGRIAANYNAKYGTSLTHDDVKHWRLQNTFTQMKNWTECIDPAFWTSLELYPWAMGLMHAVKKTGWPYTFLTAPPDTGSVEAFFKGRAQWLDAKFTDKADDLPSTHMVVATRKDLVLHPDDLYIEDMPPYIEAARKVCGGVLPLPQPWNEEVKDRAPLSEILGLLEFIASRSLPLKRA